MSLTHVIALAVAISALVAWTLGHAPNPSKPAPPAPSRARLFMQTLLVSFFVLYLGLTWFGMGSASVPSAKLAGGGAGGGLPTPDPRGLAGYDYDMQLGEPPF